MDGTMDAMTVAFDADLNQLWTERIDQEGLDEETLAIEVVGSSLQEPQIVIVAGSTTTAASGKDFLVMAYRASDGKPLWKHTYASENANDDTVAGISVTGNTDINSYVAVTGTAKRLHEPRRE